MKRQRRLLDLTQADLAKRVGCARVTIHKIESDDLRPSKQLAELLAQVLQIPIAERAAFVELARGAELPEERRAPAPTNARMPANLPVQLTSFVGRQREIAEVRHLLTSARLVTLTGSGGTGKTRLSIQVAADLLDQYPDGVWFVELAPLADAAFVPQTVASTLGLREELGRPISATLTDYLREKQLLLLLDNCEHLIEACARCADMLLHAAPQLKILASSREALGIAGESAYRVPSLPIPNPKDLIAAAELEKFDAVRLFAERAVAARSDFAHSNANAPAVAQICYRLDGIPLAIELAAARVKVFSAEQIAAHLDDRFRLLTGGSRTALPRQQTLRGAIDWSHSLLSESERILLRRLSVFAGGWSFEATEAVCAGDGIESLAILDLLTHLVDKSLVLVEGAQARYRLLETIRQYARDKLLESAEGERVRNRHLDFFVALAEEAEPKLWSAEQVLWFDRLELEHDNLRTALDWSLEGTQLERGLHLAGTLGYFWYVRGHLVEGLTRLKGLLARSQSLGPAAARAQAFMTAGWFTYDKRDYAAARVLLEQALSMARAVGDKRTIALSLNFQGATAIAQDDPTGARPLLEESLTLLAALGDKSGLAQTLWFLGDATLLEREYARARGLYEQSLELLLESGDRNSEATVYRPLAYIALHEGDYSRAAALCRECLNCNLEVREMGGVIRSIGGFAIVAAARGQFAHATRLLGAVEALLALMHYQLYPLDRIEYDRTMAVLRTQLNESTFNAAWQEGGALTLDQAVALALEEPQG